MGFPLRLLAREVFDRVRAIKGDAQVALITGEERIEPPNARYFLCTAEAMPRLGGSAAFVALDEAQLAADRERGHVFTDRLLHARGREETMLLGSATLENVLRQLEPRAQITTRPRFSTLKHIGPRKLSRLPRRSAVVGFSTEQVYAAAEMLRRTRGGAAVVMGALSPETRNKQVAMFQSGEVDYIVATDAIGMGLNLDLDHVAFASLTKFDGQRQRRLEPAELAQIAGRAGRHHRDGTFGTLAGLTETGRGRPAAPPELSDEEVAAIEDHRFAPLTRLFWREPEPRFDTLATLLADLEAPPADPALAAAPEAIDLAVLRRLAGEPFAAGIVGAGQVRRFWEACSLPDFRGQGVEMHARFVARLWEELRAGHLGADYVAARIAELDNVGGDIATLQGRIAAIRSWAYICQRPDWVLARDEMAARARAAEARLSDALHGRLVERFVHRRTALLVRSAGAERTLPPIRVDEAGAVLIEDEPVGQLRGFRFALAPGTTHGDGRLLLAAVEKAMPRLLAARAGELLASKLTGLELHQGTLRWEGEALARIEWERGARPRLVPGDGLRLVPAESKAALLAAMEQWLGGRLAPLQPMTRLQAAAEDPATGSHARAVLHRLLGAGGTLAREDAGLDHLPPELRPALRRLGVQIGALDVFVPALLKPAARQALFDSGRDPRPVPPSMPPVLPNVSPQAKGTLPPGYRRAGEALVRVDMAEKLLARAHETRAGTSAQALDLHATLVLASSIGLPLPAAHALLAQGGFRPLPRPALPVGAFGPPRPERWRYRPSRTRNRATKAKNGGKTAYAGRAASGTGGAFAGLGALLQ